MLGSDIPDLNRFLGAHGDVLAIGMKDQVVTAIAPGLTNRLFILNIPELYPPVAGGDQALPIERKGDSGDILPVTAKR